jgi:hypothetical protein
MKTIASLSALVAMLFSVSPVMSASPEGPASSISVYAGGAFMRQYYDDCGYYSDDCGGYYDRSDTYSGAEFGVDARIVTSAGILFDLSAEHARVSDYGDAFLEQQVTAGVGYQGRMGRGAHWYAEGFYQYYRLGEDFDGCTYSCNGWYKANGGGLKGGFTWPFANRFFATLNMRVSYLSGKDSDIDLVQAKLDGSVGYMITETFSAAIGASSQAIQQAHDRHYYDDYGYSYDHSDDTLSHTAVFLNLAMHF